MGLWHKSFYITTPYGEKEMRDAIADPDTGAENLADIKRRRSEMEDIPEGRCVVTSEQRRFLDRVLSTL